MCGIAGQFLFEGAPADRDLVSQMGHSLAHRGPDDEGFYFAPGVGLAHRRLSMIDLAQGKQPMTNEDQSLWMICNGEIYNFVELRESLEAQGHRFSTQCDVEVIVHLFEERGAESFNELVGMFAFCLWDAKAKELYLVRDRFGMKPLYYTADSKGLLFSSELRSLLHYSELDTTLDADAIDQYFTYLFILEPATIFKSVRKLQAGHYLIRSQIEMKIERYSNDESLPSDGSSSTPSEEVYSLLRESVRITLRCDVPVGILLSGGVDSSCVVAAASEYLESIPTFSVVFQDQRVNEQHYSRLVSKAFRTSHSEFLLDYDEAASIAETIVSKLDEPLADSSCIPTFFVTREAGRTVKALLTGDGGDELFGGYPWHERKDVPLGSPLGCLEHPTRFIMTEAQRGELFSPVISEALSSCNPLTSLGIGNAYRDIEDQWLRVDQATYLPSDILTKVDRMSMLNSVEVRIPMLNHPLSNAVNSLPSSEKFQGGVSKYVLREAFRHALPKEILERGKMGFQIPIDVWIWKPGRFRDLVYDTLSAESMASASYFNHSFIRRILLEHDRLDALHGHTLWSLFIFESWYRKFLQNG